MVKKTRLTLLAATVGGIAVLGAAHELARLRDLQAYNAALATSHYAEAAAHAGLHGVFAAAYAAHVAGDFQQARQLYSRLERSAPPPLRATTHYNIGNTYLEQAAAIDREAEADRAVPLVELAKASYREALRLDDTLWDARYNLERALELSPDVGERKLMELEGQRRNVRSFNATDPEGALP
ncbi:MAG: MxaK protein [Gammaproteobacteria bacterium]|nr:MxaK protein [Gammaproteobacteria bacterium]